MGQFQFGDAETRQEVQVNQRGNKENKNLVGQITIGDSRVRIPSAVTLVADLSLDKQMLQDVLRKKP